MTLRDDVSGDAVPFSIGGASVGRFQQQILPLDVAVWEVCSVAAHVYPGLQPPATLKGLCDFMMHTSQNSGTLRVPLLGDHVDNVCSTILTAEMHIPRPTYAEIVQEHHIEHSDVKWNGCQLQVGVAASTP